MPEEVLAKPERPSLCVAFCRTALTICLSVSLCVCLCMRGLDICTVEMSPNLSRQTLRGERQRNRQRTVDRENQGNIISACPRPLTSIKTDISLHVIISLEQQKFNRT